MREIEVASKIKFTGIVNNSNIGNFTTADDIKGSVAYAEKLALLSGIPVVMTTATGSVFDEIKNDIPNAFYIDLQDKYYDIK